jgi:hypothetical protein
MLNELSEIVNEYIENDLFYNMGLAGTYYSPSKFYNYQYIEGLFTGKHFAMLKNYLRKTCLMNTDHEFMHGYDDGDFEGNKFKIHMVQYIGYFNCIKYLLDLELPANYAIALLERALYLKKQDLADEEPYGRSETRGVTKLKFIYETGSL